ncbi:MAG: hypothetical protein V4773_01630, partial [Verrucomicrobiota bacterium]
QSQSHLRNISSRCWVGAGESIAIAGMQLPTNRRLLIRAIGPSLAQFGVNGVLTDPKLEIVRPAITTVLRGGPVTLSAQLLTANDDWHAQTIDRVPTEVSWVGSADEIRGATGRAGAFPLAEGTKDAAMLVVVGYSPLTVQVSGVSGSTGVALVEVYDVEGSH